MYTHTTQIDMLLYNEDIHDEKNIFSTFQSIPICILFCVGANDFDEHESK